MVQRWSHFHDVHRTDWQSGEDDAQQLQHVAGGEAPGLWHPDAGGVGRVQSIDIERHVGRFHVPELSDDVTCDCLRALPVDLASGVDADLGVGVEVRVTTPAPMRVLVTPASRTELGLTTGKRVYLLIKAAAFHRLV